MKKYVKKLFYKSGGLVAALALVVTTLNINTTCMFMAHQPKLPTSASKLRKF